MTYQEQIKNAVQGLYNETKRLAPSRHYTFSYGWVKEKFGLDLSQADIRSDVCEMSYADGFCDLIQTVDFDNDNREVMIMMWESNNKKKYTIEDYEAFTREALDAPPVEQFEDGTIDEEQWYEDNKILITKGQHQMELDYTADNVNEIDFALKEMYEVEMDIRSATTGNTVGSELRPAELKDILRIAIQNDWEDYGYQRGDFVTFVREFIKGYDDITNILGVYDDIIYKDVKWYNEICKCNFGKLDMLSLRHIDRRHIQDAIKELVCADMELLVGYDNCNRCSDITFIMDNTFKPSGELIGWFYGEQDADYTGQLIADYKKKLFEEE